MCNFRGLMLVFWYTLAVSRFLCFVKIYFSDNFHNFINPAQEEPKGLYAQKS